MLRLSFFVLFWISSGLSLSWHCSFLTLQRHQNIWSNLLRAVTLCLRRTFFFYFVCLQPDRSCWSPIHNTFCAPYQTDHSLQLGNCDNMVHLNWDTEDVCGLPCLSLSNPSKNKAGNCALQPESVDSVHSIGSVEIKYWILHLNQVWDTTIKVCSQYISINGKFVRKTYVRRPSWLSLQGNWEITFYDFSNIKSKRGQQQRKKYDV